ncbi:MAG: gliding motility lipoprotein GldD [Paludibacter sp.]|nr:gliding motility lipoprotein GldD [Paludibacter sp.]MDD4198125.1 gliding motility lipoprotein GldD [Paludibacter sp.]MDD4427379.1 gliding motility lipoprotein GldD [Paludibacter sp.]
MKRMYSFSVLIASCCLLTVILTSCKKNYYPKPYGYFRVDLPDNEYVRLDTLLPYTFDISSFAVLEIKQKEKYWINIVYPELNAAIHCSYKAVDRNLYELSEDAHRSVYKHLIRADDITEQVFSNPERKVYGIYYDLKGNAASVAQFVLTDSINHFFRGAVYFNHVPNKDSIAPMSDYIKQDVIRLMESFSWK